MGHASPPPHVSAPRVSLSLNSPLFHVGFVALFIGLEATSFFHPLHELNVTPWHPAPAMALVYLVRRGREAWLPLFAALLLCDWLIHDSAVAWWVNVLSNGILGFGLILLAGPVKRQLSLATPVAERGFSLKLILLVGLGTLAINLTQIASQLPFDELAARRLWEGLPFLIGDAFGIAVSLPLFWWLSSAPGRSRLKAALMRWDTLGYFLLSLVVLWFGFDFSGERGYMLYFLLFLPIVWASARQGMAGAILAYTLLQVETVLGVQALHSSFVTLAELQSLTLAMAVIGFFIGSTVDALGRTSRELRQTLRLAAAGEMAGALAHELNQPLTALGAYAAACDLLLQRGEAGEKLASTVRGLCRETERAGDVVKRLRDFFRTGATHLEPVTLSALVDRLMPRYLEQATRLGLRFQVEALPEVTLLVDVLQLEVVLRNLFSNAFEAAATAPGERQVRLRGERWPGNQVCLMVEDSGAGLSEQTVAQVFEPYASAKPGGLGMGLFISHAIVEAHGGRLWAEAGRHGVFKLVLPLIESDQHD